MLTFPPTYTNNTYAYGGSGIFNIASNLLQKTANSGLAKKVINSTTTQNLKRAANSTLGKELQKSALSGVSRATEKAAESVYEKLGLEPSKKRRKKAPKKKVKGKGIVYD